MSFSNDKLRPIILETLGSFTLAGAQVGVTGWSKDQSSFLEYCLKQKILSEEEFKEVVTDRIKYLGRKSYDEHIDKGIAPDHTTSPNALSYAIRTEALTSAEVDKIKFDHGDNRFTFFEEDWRMLPYFVSEALQPEPDPD